MNQRERQELDRHITGNFGEDFFDGGEEYQEPEYPSDEAVRAYYADLGLPADSVVSPEQEEDDEPFLPDDD